MINETRSGASENDKHPNFYPIESKYYDRNYVAAVAEKIFFLLPLPLPPPRPYRQQLTYLP
jgi:hypothetical protein